MIYSTRELLKITEETRQRIQYWILNGIISPYDPSAGTGTTRRYSFENLLEVMIVKTLSVTNIPIRTVERLVKQVKRENPDYFITPIHEEVESNQLVLGVDIFSFDAKSARGTYSIVTTLAEAQSTLPGMLNQGDAVIYLNLDVIKNNLVHKLELEKR